MIPSPLNYTGGEYRLLPQITPLFPKDVSTFVDLFCGGCNVGINADSRRVIYNDINRDLLSIYGVFKTLGRECLLDSIYGIIERYGLSLTSRYGYSHYGCDSGSGLAGYNRDKYLKLRADFNERRLKGSSDICQHIMLYVLIVYAFNNQIRFNSDGRFNLPVGKRDFNSRMERKLLDFTDRLKAQDCLFTCRDFREFDTSPLTPRDLVYADPPYLITCATYNEKGGWGESAERDLLAFLDELHSRHIPFALSNVLRSKGKENHILIRWLESRAGIYTAVPLNHSYSNSNYQTKDRTSASEEVLIINYPLG